MRQDLYAASLLVAICALNFGYAKGQLKSCFFGPVPQPDPDNPTPYHWMKQAVEVIRKNCPGRRKTQDIDPCTANPCQHGGTCVRNSSSIFCKCADGFIGEFCQEEAIISGPYYCLNKTVSGVYKLSEPNTVYDGKDVYCEVDGQGGSWLVFQRRLDGSTDFYRDRQSYEDGFGDVTGNLWLGNGLVHYLTTSKGQWTLKVDLVDWNDTTAYAQYDTFALGSSPGFALSVADYHGTAGDSMDFHNGHEFTTKDYDRDGASGGNCAVWLQGAWWYAYCHRSALNGKYLLGGFTDRDNGIQWVAWKGHYYSMKSCQLKIRLRT